MRINVYESELTQQAEVVQAVTHDGTFFGLKMTMKSPASLMEIERESAVTIWASTRSALSQFLAQAQTAVCSTDGTEGQS